MIQQRSFGRAGVTVPVIGMGTWRTFDVRDREVESRRAIVRAALDLGMHVFDSSPMYGRAERVLARALDGRRGEAFVATKLWTSDDAEAERQARSAVQMYGGRVDLYQVHNLVAWRTRLDQMERLRAEGKVRLLGVTHWSSSAFDEIVDAMRTGRVDAVQVPYNPRERDVERWVLPTAAELGVGVLVMRPFAEGGLMRRRPSDAALAPLRAYGVTTWAHALLKWVLSDERVTAVIPATSSLPHVHDNAAAGSPPYLDSDARALVARLAGSG